MSAWPHQLFWYDDSDVLLIEWLKFCRLSPSSFADSCNGLSFSSDETKVFKYEDGMTPPTYLVGIDILKADSHSYDPVLTQKSSQCWQSFFSISLTLPNLLQKDASADGLFLHDARIVANGNWNRPSSYFQRGSSILVCLLLLIYIPLFQSAAEQFFFPFFFSF